MEQTALTSAQKIVIETLAREPQLANFYLTGGTALAVYYLHHRVSDDLDFFSFEAPDMIFLHSSVENLKNKVNARKARYERRYDRNMFFFDLVDGELKVEFTKYPFKQLEEPKTIDGLKVDSLRDIGANKLMTILDRFDPKDFVDLYFLFQSAKLEDLRRDAETKFGVKIGGIFLGAELSKVRRIEVLPKMIKPLTIGELKEFFSEQIRGLSSEILE